MNRYPHLKIYRGFGNESNCTIIGHALLLSPLKRERYNGGWWHNMVSLLRLFMVKPYAKATIRINWQHETYYTKTEDDGFFTLDVTNKPVLNPGKYEIRVSLLDAAGTQTLHESIAQVTIPERNQFAFISDIDDTFLISHSATIFKRMKVLLTRNAHSRKPFEGVVNHYNALQLAQTTPDDPNPFFYVSSSEWNLYDFIIEFIAANGLPDGICLLNQIKTISQVLKTGKNNHASKFTRIVRILEAYPKQRFILLGDDSQHDPYIYASLCEHFPHLIHCVYIRQVRSNPKQKVQAIMKNIETYNVATCYFKHSSEAFAHSRQIGLVS